MRAQWLRPVQRRAALTVATLLTLVRTTDTSAQQPTRPPLTEVQRAVHLLSRTTYGVREQDVEEVLRVGRSAWLTKQMAVEYPLPVPGGVVLPQDPSLRITTAGAVRMMRNAPDRRAMQESLVTVLRLNPVTNLAGYKLDRAARAEIQVAEVMTDFWFNHFSVDYVKPGVALALADYEDVIWRHIFGRFEDLLTATARHPAMLAYLDNAVSKADGLNENYARELLELHTLGVDGGYTQQDVIEVARAFTGWSTYSPQRPAFEFQLSSHDVGSKLVLGETLAADRGLEDGLDVIRLLARHPSTARHIARKLARHFVADQPPAELVAQLERVFLETDGDLRQVTRALFESEAFYDPAHYQAKVKRPFEFVVSALRLSGLGNVPVLPASTVEMGYVALPLFTFGHMPYGYPAPTGYPSQAEEWVSAGAMIARMDFALNLTEGSIGGFPFDPTGAFDWILQVAGGAGAPAGPTPAVATTAPSVMPSTDVLTAAVLRQVMYGRSSDALRASIAADLARQTTGDPRVLVARALALALGSPEFQRY